MTYTCKSESKSPLEFKQLCKFFSISYVATLNVKTTLYVKKITLRVIFDTKGIFFAFRCS